MDLSTNRSSECRKSDMLFLKLASATCKAPQTIPSMVSGLSAYREGRKLDWSFKESKEWLNDHVMMGGVRLRVHTCTFSAMRWSSHPVSMSLFLKLSVSSNLMRYSTVVLKSPLMDSSFIATTMFLTPTETGTFILASLPLMKAKQIKKNLTKWLLHGFHPRRNSVQTASPQTREVHQLLPRWNNPRHFYCCGSSALARCLNWVWSPVSENQTTQKSNNRLQKNVSVRV